MSRKKSAKVHEVLADPIFNSVVVTKLINTIMLDGKKSIAQDILYSAFDLVKEKTKKDPMQVFTQAVENITPQLEIR
ncbi:30S ribosomal protein S7, partial [Mycoplasmopsis synoviae]